MAEKNFCFHEARILEFTKHPTSISLRLENVRVDGQIKNTELSFIDVKTLEVEHNPPKYPLMAAEFGEIVFIELHGNKAELFILWRQFSQPTPNWFEKFYFIDCEQIDIKITDPEMSPEFYNVKKEDLSFHEALVMAFNKNPTSILLCLDGIKVGRQFKYAELLFEGIKKVEIDDEPTELPPNETIQGKVLTLKFNDHKVDLVIEWTDPAQNVQFVRFYLIEYEDTYIKII